MNKACLLCSLASTDDLMNLSYESIIEAYLQITDVLRIKSCGNKGKRLSLHLNLTKMNCNKGTSAFCYAIDTCDGFQRFVADADPIESDGSCVFYQSLKATEGNHNRSAKRTHVWWVAYDDQCTLTNVFDFSKR